MKIKQYRKRLLWFILTVLVLMNIIAAFHAYKFTHFSSQGIAKTAKPEELSLPGKIKALLLGVSNPKPMAKAFPQQPYEAVLLQGIKKTACWEIKNSTASQQPPRGTVIICHGYGSEKSSMLDKAIIFDSLGYNCLLLDFMGSGESEGNTTTIGYKEATQVQSAFEYLQQKGEKNIILFGTSMGAAAIMKAITDYQLNAQGLVLECPFGTMYQTVCARFRNMNVPAFPMAGILLFWGGVENSFWAFGHNPVEYAKNINAPTLLLYGEKDKNVSRQETDEIFNNLNGKKYLKTYAEAGHENYVLKYKQQWISNVSSFLNSL